MSPQLRSGYLAAIFTTALATPSIAFAQAWVPTELSLSVTAEYSFVYSSADVFSEEVMFPTGPSGMGDPETTRFRENAKLRTHLFVPSVDFTPVANLGLRVWL